MQELVLKLDISKLVNSMQFWNILSIFITLFVSNFEISKYFNPEHPLNISVIIIAFPMENLDKSKEVKE